MLESQQHSTVVCKDTTFRLRSSSWCEIMCRVTFSHHTNMDNTPETLQRHQRGMTLFLFFGAIQAQSTVETRAVKCYASTFWINLTESACHVSLSDPLATVKRHSQGQATLLQCYSCAVMMLSAGLPLIQTMLWRWMREVNFFEWLLQTSNRIKVM